jgi:hypothetical protein
LNQFRCRLRADKNAPKPGISRTFPCFGASAETRCWLKLLRVAGGVAAVALQLGFILGRSAVRGAELLARGGNTKTTFHCTLLRICRHSQNPPGLLLSCRMQAFCAEMPEDALTAAFQQMGRVLQARLGELGAAQHPCDLLRPFGVFHAANLSLGPPTLLGLLYQEVLVPERRNLR